MVTVGLLETRMVGRCQGYVPVKKGDSVLPVVCFPIRDNIWQREGWGSVTELFLCFLFLFDFLEKGKKKQLNGWKQKS